MSDPVNHPPHYTAHPSGVECIEITEDLPFCLGNAIKYVWRAGLKGSAAEDLKKAAWYLRREASHEQKHLVMSQVQTLASRVCASEPKGSALRDLLLLFCDRWVTPGEMRDAADRIERQP